MTVPGFSDNWNLVSSQMKCHILTAQRSRTLIALFNMRRDLIESRVVPAVLPRRNRVLGFVG